MTRHDARHADAGTALPDAGRRPWRVAPEQGVVQGPLDLALFAGERLQLTLQEGQCALLERAGALVGVLGAGVHEVAGGGSCRAYFVHLDRPVSWQWQEGSVLWVGPRAARRAVPIIGACAVLVANATSFYRACLHGARPLEDGHLPRLLDAVVRDRLESRMERVAAAGAADPATIQTLLANVAPRDLTEDLDEYGLACTHLAVYTRQAPVVETTLAGHFPGHRDNNS